MCDASYGFRARIAGYQMAYLPTLGKHLGAGENDVGEYREWKTEMHQKNLEPFHRACRAYLNKTKPIYLPFDATKYGLTD